MRYNKEITVMIALGALAATSAAQQISGNVTVNASVSGGSHPGEQWAVLKPGQTSLFKSTSDASPAVTANSVALAQPGFVGAVYSGRSDGNPYGSGYAYATYVDAVRLTGSTPLTLTFKVLQATTCYTDGTDPGQTSAGNYGAVSLTGQGVNIQQTRQEATGGFGIGSLHDVTVTLQPNTWYRLYMQAKGYGDTSDSSKPFTTTNSNAASSIASWFELPPPPIGSKSLASFGGGGTPFLESESGFDYSKPNVQAVPEPASMGALAVGVLGLLRRRRGTGIARMGNKA